MTPVAGLLFDVDGTLIDSNDAHAKAWVDVFTEFGINVEYSEVRKRIGMGGDHLLPDLLSISAEDPKAKALEKRRGEIFRQNYLPTLKAFDGAKELLETLKAKGYRLAIATSASSKDLKGLLDQAGLSGIVEEQATATDADHSKPEPDIINAALKKVSVSSERAVMVGDTPYDIIAAKRAKVRSIAFTCGGWSKEDLEKAGASVVYESPRVFLDEIRKGQASL